MDCKFIERIINMIKELFIDEKKSFLEESKNKVICKYRVIDDLHKIAEGELFFKGQIYKFLSGGYGKGYAEKGLYKAYKLLSESRPAFCQFGFGWQVPMDAQFKTERRGLAIHPDGNVPGSEGCPVINFSNLDENVKCHNLFRDWFENKKVLEVEVV